VFVGAISQTHEEENQGPTKTNNKGGKNWRITIRSKRSTIVKQQKLIDLLGNKVTIFWCIFNKILWIFNVVLCFVGQ
jgi:hypothetical protein